MNQLYLLGALIGIIIVIKAAFKCLKNKKEGFCISPYTYVGSKNLPECQRATRTAGARWLSQRGAPAPNTKAPCWITNGPRGFGNLQGNCNETQWYNGEYNYDGQTFNLKWCNDDDCTGDWGQKGGSCLSRYDMGRWGNGWSGEKTNFGSCGPGGGGYWDPGAKGVQDHSNYWSAVSAGGGKYNIKWNGYPDGGKCLVNWDGRKSGGNGGLGSCGSDPVSIVTEGPYIRLKNKSGNCFGYGSGFKGGLPSFGSCTAKGSRFKMMPVKPMSPQYKLVRRNSDCNSSDSSLGKFNSVQDCSIKCQNTPGCKLFLYGQGRYQGNCWAEHTAGESCSEGWTSNPNTNAFISKKPCKRDPANQKWYRCTTGSTYATYNKNSMCPKELSFILNKYGAPARNPAYYACAQGCRGTCRVAGRGILANI